MVSRTIALVLFITIIFSGCVFQDINKRKYNELSRQHNQAANEALIKKNQAVDEYNEGNYQEARTTANSAKDLFIEAKDISEQNQKIAQEIKDIDWLAGYQTKVIQSEVFWIEIMEKFIAACDAQLSGDLTTANKIAKELEKKIPEYEKIQKEIDQIEEDHKDFFNGEEISQ